MGDFSISELVVVGVIAIVIWGKDLPVVAKKLAKWYNKIRRQLTDIKDEISSQIPDEELNSIKDSVKIDEGDPTSVPDAPAGLMAESTDEQVYLSWDLADRAATYTVKRSRDSEEPHVTIASELTDPSYADSDITQGDVYYYVVTSVNSIGESENSEEAMVTIPVPGSSAYTAASGTDGNGAKGKKKAGGATRRSRGARKTATPTSRKRKGKK